MNLTDKIVVVTGGGSGIGAEIAARFAGMGNTVIICGRDKAKLTSAASKMGAFPIQCDVTSPDECQAMLDVIIADHQRLDILVNCAGVMFGYDFAEDPGTAEKIQTEIDINAIAPLRLTHAALPILNRSPEAAVVFVSSGLAYSPFAGTPAYSGTKALIHHSAKALRHQFKKRGIKVFELLPPITDTPMAHGANTGGFKKSSPAEVVNELIEGMERDRYEIAAGASKLLRIMSRVAPGFLFNQMTKAFEKEAR
ncbi:MAG: SDR family NAD(P)-dependent oxidoreductase [Erythrobacter sp.]